MNAGKEQTILLTGVNGQVGFELARTLQGLGKVVALDRSGLDLADLDQVRRVVREVKPGLIVNPAAHTAVDKAETDVEAAMRLNAEAPGVLAEEARKIGAALVHYSTDYVFDGTKAGLYAEDDPVNPQNVYGKSKLAGEQAIANSGCPHLIFRTSWVYGTRGKNFLLTMLRLGAERSELSVVADQFGAPTWANTIAALSANVLAQAVAPNQSDWWEKHSGIYHLTASGATSWHGFAEAIFEFSDLEKKPTVKPIPAAAYPTPATRPSNSRMSNEKLAATFGVRAPDWREALRLCLATR
ncbi:dTDP-4-dehydrorhamnose reductase [bacterium M00.F.Ca.ET.228.01.1.1]|uniref:dTDP-4-dehydrorhamnose reductase n=1 Tax=Paraburkholderia phenoliruptrix TaxID=252970 RepID=UPI001092396B|nr:dTDP-4-dehydrorhamnose reductase [Paraburkholderia phenoliruptrix]TGP43123.1 dTDP-4-dehydrorhamnose reductase [bacterium M00.F.Ca.ET.228.01.1.1]TGS00562.1 dTDP-4-dehydrorhamnose reductase [bacterium M00.F.Ca.ET.191.01.1.1]TGU04948.1 dTDP-4-dehydrorhamnose reductase [bacterium M00.F.Ca.ET.155.01.1.1]MBW0446945.1 dTDP-4-dehydrorhamnose reductase [Paraburkholderia phenoliruptrix]MBW9099441.1 dTDP-4-dehydrorhamnose reductase [Paraburkholderia phenoliruptrix]